jgi:hypothetical protein
MNNQHPITPPPELLEQWEAETAHTTKDETWHVAVQAARWGADQELEACCGHIRNHQWGFVDHPDGFKIHRAIDLKLARRPKPPSLKEQALARLAELESDEPGYGAGIATIRRALEQLP